MSIEQYASLTESYCNCNLLSGLQQSFPECDVKIRRLELRMSRCGEVFFSYLCLDCLKRETHVSFCGVRYCENYECVEYRTKKAFSILMQKGSKMPKWLWHIVTSEVVDEVNAESITKIYNDKRKFLQNMKRSHNAKFYSLGVLDFEKLPDGKMNLHFHWGVMPTGQYLNFDWIRKEWLNVSGGVLKVIGKRKKTGLFWYFAQRAAGVFSHNTGEKEKFGFRDVMCLYFFVHNIYKRKWLFSSLPVGLSCSITSINHRVCVHCGSDNVVIVFHLPVSENDPLVREGRDGFDDG